MVGTWEEGLPDVLQVPHELGFAAIELLGVALHKQVVEAAVIVGGGLGAEHARIGGKAASHHHCSKGGVALDGPLDVLDGAQAAVIDNRPLRGCQQCFELLHIEIPLVLLLADARVHGYVAGRYDLQQGQDVSPLVVAVPAEAHLHAVLHVLDRCERLEQGCCEVRECQHARAFAMKGDGRKWASQIDVDVTVAHLLEGFHHHQGMVALASENLWHKGDAGIALGRHVAQVFAPDLTALDAHKRGIIGIHSAKHDVLRHAPHTVGHTLQRCCKHWYLDVIHIYCCMMAEYLPPVMLSMVNCWNSRS